MPEPGELDEFGSGERNRLSSGERNHLSSCHGYHPEQHAPTAFSRGTQPSCGSHQLRGFICQVCNTSQSSSWIWICAPLRPDAENQYQPCKIIALIAFLSNWQNQSNSANPINPISLLCLFTFLVEKSELNLEFSTHSLPSNHHQLLFTRTLSLWTEPKTRGRISEKISFGIYILHLTTSFHFEKDSCLQAFTERVQAPSECAGARAQDTPLKKKKIRDR